MRHLRLAAVLCLLALLAPAGAALAHGLERPACADGCCDEGDCGGDSDDGCPDGCPDCACSAVARIAVPVPDVIASSPEMPVVAVLSEPEAEPADGEPRGILHVPRG